MLNVYLSGEIHTDWRDEIIQLCKKENLDIKFSSPNTDHESSDNCGVEILGAEENNFWKDNKGASINSIKTKIDNLLLYIPNIPSSTAPNGKSELDNVLIKEWGEKPEFDFEIKDHLELMTSLNMLDMATGAKISGTGFPVYKSKGAKLERSLINFMLEEHINNGYEEIFPPFLSK